MKLVYFILCLWFVIGCQPDRVTTPKPRQYPRLELPHQVYERVVPEECPFQIDIPQSGSLNMRKGDDAGEHPCWFDITWPVGVTLYCSYYPIDKQYSLTNLIDDAYEMVSKHNVKANFRDEIEVSNSFGHEGLIFDIRGPVASAYQFYISDKEDHFLRGSLYFDTKVSRDSVAPILEYLQEDINHMLASLEFN